MCYVVIDLEMCSVPKAKRNKNYQWANETIQIGAVMLDENYNIVDKFMTYVSPQYGFITPAIERLTGISRQKLEGAPDMSTALKMFASWLPEQTILAAWSENDEMQIMREIKGKEIEFEGINKITDCWVDCQITFSEIIGNKRRYNLQEALNLSGIEYDLHIHDGLVDACNTALLFKKMKTEKVFSFSKYYLEADKETTCMTYSLGSLISRLDSVKMA